MQYKTLFLVIVSCSVGGLVFDVRAEYMEPQMCESRTKDAEPMDVDVSRDSFNETTHERPTREEQTRADNDPRVQSCIAEAIEGKYCS